MYKEPWSDISEYPEKHGEALRSELLREVSESHILHGKEFKVLAKREDCDDILVSMDECYFVVHLTWSGKQENSPYPMTDKFKTMEKLKAKLAQDSECF